jgi:hypothetical protein
MTLQIDLEMCQSEHNLLHMEKEVKRSTETH